jgi:hypothetical protein
MSEYRLDNVQDFVQLDQEAHYIVLFGVDKVPPHIGFVTNGRYFSQSSVGGKFNHDFNNVMKSVSRKGIATVLIKLIKEGFKPEAFFTNTPLDLGESCLEPIKKMFVPHGLDMNDHKYVFDVITFLEKKSYIYSIEQLACEKLLDQKCLILEKYTQKEIDRAIADAKRPC